MYDNREVTNSQTIKHSVEDGESTKNYFNNGVEAYEITECFDEEGRVNETITYDVAKDEESVITLEYDDRGRVTKEEITTDEEVISVTNVVFDEYDNQVKLIKSAKLAEDFYDTATYKFVNEYHLDE